MYDDISSTDYTRLLRFRTGLYDIPSEIFQQFFDFSRAYRSFVRIDTSSFDMVRDITTGCDIRPTKYDSQRLYIRFDTIKMRILQVEQFFRV